MVNPRALKMRLAPLYLTLDIRVCELGMEVRTVQRPKFPPVWGCGRILSNPLTRYKRRKNGTILMLPQSKYGVKVIILSSEY